MMDLIIALLPIATLILSVLLFKRTITQAVLISLIVLLLSSIYWGLGFETIAASSLRGVFLAIEIIIIVFSAVLIFEILERQRLFSVISRKLDSVSSDKVIQTLFVLLGVVFFMEGVAGFGTPAIIAIPLLLAIGYKPTQAVILSLLADSIPVSFGAVGLPVSFGIGSIVSSIQGIDNVGLLNSVVARIALINILGMLILSLILLATIKSFLKDEKIKISSYLTFVIPVVLISSLVALFVAVFVGPELPSIIGGITAIAVMVFLSSRRRTVTTSKEAVLNESATLDQASNDNKHLYRALIPYGLLISLLLLSRLPIFGVVDFLQDITVSNGGIFGSDVSYSLAPFYSAATILLLVAIFSLFWFHESAEKTKSIVTDVLKLVSRPFIALLLTLVFVQIFINSQSIELQAMPVLIAEYLSSSAGSMWPLISPFVGALGSFLAGSATVSNLIFSGIQYDVAVEASLSTSSVLSLQSLGAALGNMIALHNVIAALTIAKLSEKSASVVIKYNGKYLALFLLIIGILGLVIV